MVDVTNARPRRLNESIELFYFAYRGFTDRADRLLARHGLARVHHRILYFVGRQPGLAVSDLLKTLAISKQALNAPLRQLVSMRLVEVQVAPRDRRLRQLSLSAAGRKLERTLSGRQMALLQAAFASAGEGSESHWQAVMAVLAGR